MKLIDRYEFTNGKYFETYYIDRAETEHRGLPECDVIGFIYDDNNGGHRFIVMRPDEALIQARMLIDAVNKVTEGYETSAPKENEPLARDLVEDLTS